MVSKTISKAFIALVAIIMALPVAANTTGGVEIKTEKPVYQDADASQPNYLKSRRALVGPGCTVNSLFDGVSLVAGRRISSACATKIWTTMPPCPASRR